MQLDHDMPLTPWDDAIAQEATRRLNLVCAAVLKDGEEVRINLNGRVGENLTENSTFSGTLDRARLDLLVQMVMKLVPVTRLIPPGVDKRPNYSAELLHRRFFASGYSGHDRIQALHDLPVLLAENGASPDDIRSWLNPEQEDKPQ